MDVNIGEWTYPIFTNLLINFYVMKKKYYLLALASLMMAACSDDDSLFTGGPENGNPAGKTITFVFPGTAQGVVPYAALATDAENELKTLDIYVFGEDSLAADPKPVILKEIFRSGEAGNSFTLTPVGTSYQATISVYPGEQKKFYFVANGRDNLSLDSLELGVTDTTAFLAKATNTLKGHIACPLLMSGSFPELGTITVPEGGLGGNQEVHLTRRMARFDVLNWCEESSFKISEIVLKDIPGSNSIFAQATPYTPTIVASLPIIDFTAYENSNYGESKSVFYMYPAMAVETQNIKLSLVGETLAGAAQVYNVEFKKNQSDVNTIPVLANNRYLLSILNVGSGTLDATLEVKDWLVGDTVNSDVTHGTIKLSVDAAGLKAGQAFADNTLSLPAATTGETAADSVTIKVAADEEWELVKPADCDWIAFSVLPGDSVMKSFKLVTLTTNPSSKEDRVGTVIVRNVKRPSIKQPLIVKQAPNASSYIDLSGALLAGNEISFSGEKMSSDSMNIDVTVPDGATWTASESADWFNLADKAVLTRADAGFTNNDDGKTGTGSGTFSIVAQKNETDQARIDSIKMTISGPEGADKVIQYIVVKQAAQNIGSIRLAARGTLVDKDDAANYKMDSIPATGFIDAAVEGQTTEGERKVTVVAISEWTVSVESGDDWLSVSKSKTLVDGNNGYFGITAATNSTTTPRTAVLKVANTTKPTEVYKTITITQKAGTAAAPAITVDETPLAFTATETAMDTKTISVVLGDPANTWTAALAGTGFSLGGSYIAVTGNGDFTVAPDAANDTYKAKTASITVTESAGSTTKTIAVSQPAGKTVPSFATTTGSVAVDGTGLDISTIVVSGDVENISDWTVSVVDGSDNVTPVTWLTATLDSTSQLAVSMASGGDEVNSTGAERTAVIKLVNTTDNTVVSNTITVTQAGS
ncbi:Putative binding domain-containing protein, N-terminal [Parabacteroides chinchillae]|uniref:Binding domain-containing protein, N-terminal n=2 Tax=Parabacteroides chinchillae TaxID=871327 RepID=A0A8G2BZ32_9BACT|nr:Putative binding domain-containing protein, N-terminal [Parabacteroides chinchillae]